MEAFAVLLQEDKPQSQDLLRQRIEDRFPGDGHLQLNTNVYLVRGPREISDVTEMLGFDDEEPLVYGAVLALAGTYGGRSFTSTWDWMADTAMLR